MKIKLNNTLAWEHGTHAAGSIVDLPVHMAKDLLKTNQAIPVAETAAISPAETTAAVPQRVDKPSSRKRASARTSAESETDADANPQNTGT